MCIMVVKLCRSQVQVLTLDCLLWTLHGLYVWDMGVWRLQWDSFSWALGLRNWDFGVAFFFFLRCQHKKFARFTISGGCGGP